MFAIAPDPINLTINQWCERLRDDLLEQAERRELDKLASAVTVDGDVIDSTYEASGLRAGTRVEVGTELMHIWKRGATDQTFLVERGHAGSTPVAHPAGTLMRVGPRFPAITLAQELRREIRSWPVPVVAVATADFAVGAGTETFELTGLANVEVVRLLRVQREHPRSSNNSWPTTDGRLERRQGGVGYSLRLVHVHDATTVRVTLGYKHPTGQGPIDLSADLGTAFHLTAGLADAAMYGVAGRLLAAQEVERSQDTSQQRPRRAEDVPPGHRLQSGQAMLMIRDQLLKAEVERITNQYAAGF